SSSQSSTLSVMLGETGGAFLAGSLVAMAGVAGGFALGDLNGDGKPDLAAAVSSPDEIEILIGDGSGGFVPGAAIAASPHFSVGSPILADLNRDGVLDLSFFDASPFTFEGGNLVRVAKGRGDGTVDPSASYAV